MYNVFKCWGYILGVMEKKMEATIVGYIGLRA